MQKYVTYNATQKSITIYLFQKPTLKWGAIVWYSWSRMSGLMQEYHLRLKAIEHSKLLLTRI